MAIQEGDLTRRYKDKEFRKQIKRDLRRQESGKVNRSGWQNVGGMEIPQAYHKMGLVWVDKYGQQWLPKQTARELRDKIYGTDGNSLPTIERNTIPDTITNPRNIIPAHEMIDALSGERVSISSENQGALDNQPLFVQIGGNPIQVDAVLDDPVARFSAVNSATERKQNRLGELGLSIDFIERSIAASKQLSAQNLYILQAAEEGRLTKRIKRFTGEKQLTHGELATAVAVAVEDARASLKNFLVSELRCAPPEQLPMGTLIPVFDEKQLRTREVGS